MTAYPGPEPPAPPPEPEPGLPAPPGWFLLVPLAALFVWWPIDPFWASDDFFAMHYARDLGTALADFAGPQYGASDIWFFYRPLITLSFWFDGAVAGGSAFFALLHNAIFHAVSALLVVLIWRRFLADGPAFAAGLLWAVAPGHAGSILWAAGRVDSHTALWCLLSLWAFCRFREGRGPMLAVSLLAFAFALLSKELAFTVPALILLLGMAMHREGGAAARLRAGLRGCLPHLGLFAGYLALRYLALGRLLGGYDAAELAAADMPAGLLQTTLDSLAPLRYAGSELVVEHVGELPVDPAVLGYLPVILALVLVMTLRRWFALPPIALLAFLVAGLPMMPFWSQPSVHNLRYWYLPFAALAGLLAAGGPVVWVAALVTWAAPFVEVRQGYQRAHREMEAMHRALLVESREREPGLMFVAGLPHVTEDGLVVQYHFGVDRILLEPFGPGKHRVLALRPIVEVPGVRRLVSDLPFALPDVPTFFFEGPDILGMALEQRLPELVVELEGMPDFSSASLQRLADREIEGRLRMPGRRADRYRITFFTATGYLSCVVPDHGPEESPDGIVDLYRLFSEGQYAVGGDYYLLRGLEVPAVIDLEPTFPVLVEAGSPGVGGVAFVPTHRARRLIEFDFDRELPAFVRRVLGL